ncbi:hypothetical protein FRB99_004989, partial [Tulasnella sp. 403]
MRINSLATAVGASLLAAEVYAQVNGTDPTLNSTTSTNTTTDATAIPSCSTIPNAQYDYIVVGQSIILQLTGLLLTSPQAQGLAVVLLQLAWLETDTKDYVNNNTTIPLYLARATEDPEISLNYYVDLYPPGDPRNVTEWYPRSQGLGGCTIHNALINQASISCSIPPSHWSEHAFQIPHNWDFDSIQTTFNDPSWNSTTMQKYYTRIENNLYIPEDIGAPLNHGYDGWLYTTSPSTNLITDPQYYDPKLVDLLSGVENAVPPVPGSDWTTNYNDLAEGGGALILTRNSNNTRSSVRDWLAATQQLRPNGLVFQLNTLATKILTCRTSTGRVKAYGVAGSVGQDLPVSPKFKGKANPLPLTNFYAKNEVIVSTGAYQTPQLLMLSGIGDSNQLSAKGISPLVNLPGVGQNLQDRIEMTIVWHLNSSYVIWEGCKFGTDPNTDPC